VPIIGGEHGDFPLEVDQGKDLADILARHDMSCVIDLSLMHQEDQRRFMLPFAKQLLFVNRAPLMLLLEEADVLAPQISGQGGPTTLINAMHSLVKIGRQRGIIMGMFTQRPQSLNKNLISQIETLLALRVTSPRDRAAYKDWFSAHSDEATSRVMKESSTLEIGEAFCWIAGDGYFDRVQWPICRTFDSGRTPKFGDTVSPVVLPPVDFGTLKGMLREMASPACETETSDTIVKLTKEFDQRAADYERQIASLRQSLAEMARFEMKARLWDDVTALVSPHIALASTTSGLSTEFDSAPISEPSEFEPAPVKDPTGTSSDPRGRAVMATCSDDTAAPLGRSTMRILEVLYQFGAMPSLPTETQWAFAAGIDRKSSTWRAHKAKMRPHIEYEGDFVKLADDTQLFFKRTLGECTPLNRAGVMARWIRDLPSGSGRILEKLDRWGPLTKRELAELIEVDPTKSTFRAWMAPLNKLDLIEMDGNKLSLCQAITSLP